VDGRRDENRRQGKGLLLVYLFITQISILHVTCDVSVTSLLISVFFLRLVVS